MSFLLDNKKIELNNMTDISSNITYIIEEMDLTKLSKTELLEKCKALGITKCKSKNKAELIQLINNHSTKEERKDKFKYYCECCDFGVFVKSMMDTHLNTNKHQLKFNDSQNINI